MKNLIYLLGLAALLFVRPALAESHDESVHNTAHFGASYALNTFSYTIFQKAFRMDKKNALVFSVFTTLLTGFTYKYMEAMDLPGRGIPGLGRAMLWNSLGITGSILTIKIGDF